MTFEQAKLQIEAIDLDGKEWRLLAPLVYETPVPLAGTIPAAHFGPEKEIRLAASGQVEVVVPAGFVTDFASTPQAIWWLIPPTGRYEEPAVIHDLLYTYGVGTRKWADEVFYTAMAELGVPYWKRWLMWAGVRIGGRTHWGKP